MVDVHVFIPPIPPPVVRDAADVAVLVDGLRWLVEADEAAVVGVEPDARLRCVITSGVAAAAGTTGPSSSTMELLALAAVAAGAHGAWVVQLTVDHGLGSGPEAERLQDRLRAGGVLVHGIVDVVADGGQTCKRRASPWPPPPHNAAAPSPPPRRRSS